MYNQLRVFKVKLHLANVSCRKFIHIYCKLIDEYILIIPPPRRTKRKFEELFINGIQ